jgi:hypothetical protein
VRIVTVDVRELIRLVVDQNDDGVFGTEKRRKAVAESHGYILY